MKKLIFILMALCFLGACGRFDPPNLVETRINHQESNGNKLLGLLV